MSKHWVVKLFLLLFLFNINSIQAQVKKVALQGFWWDYKNNNYPFGWANYLADLAPRLRVAGLDAIWIPPVYKNQESTWVGYGPMDHYDLGDKYQKGGGSNRLKTGMGTKDEFLRMVAVMHANGIEVIQDVVLNHTDGAGTITGAGGQDPAALSMATNGGYKNFRYVSFGTPSIDESQNDYWTRSGRWSKNYTNFYPNPGDGCTTGDICSPYFGPDISYNPASIGQSSNIPTSGTVTVGGITRTYHNPTQASNYMYDGALNWLGWFKKQSGVDGFRWDAVKHFYLNIQEGATRYVKYGLPSWAQGGNTMYNVGEYIGSTGVLDGYVTAMAQPSGSYGYEEHTGTFDFNLRGYGSSGGIYSMVLGLGGYNMTLMPGDQQGKRTYDYGGNLVHRTVPFVNSHDTYRPVLLSNGNFSQPLGNSSGWNTGNELGGNGQHIDPREPRLAAAYAIIHAVDGSPMVFFEDLFDIGTTGKRYSHSPASSTDLPTRGDIVNIIRAHQGLDFKGGAYKVRSSSSNGGWVAAGSFEDHLVIERSAKAIIGITDKYNTASDNSQDEQMWVDSDFASGTMLYDYSGAHGVTGTQVQSDKRVLIKTAPVSHTIPNVFGHGYSIWAPYPGTPNSVNDLFNAIQDVGGAASSVTTQEWEMDNDLGDSHCLSLRQGGRTPDNLCTWRIVGKVYTDQAISYTTYLGNTALSLTTAIFDKNGMLLSAVSGAGASTSETFTPGVLDWYEIRVRNTDCTLGQKSWVNVSYETPSTISAVSSPSQNSTAYIWNTQGTTDWNNCDNWRNGIVPPTSDCSNLTIVLPTCACTGGEPSRPTLPAGCSPTFISELGSVFLPIELLVFNGKPEGTKAQLNWEFGSLDGVKYFILQKSNNAFDFFDIFQQNIASPFDKKLYKYTDNNFEKSSYYRLKIANADGSVEYSKIILLQKSNIFSEFKMYPNPVSDVLNVYSENAQYYEFPLKISIADLLGKKCYEEIISDENASAIMRHIDTQNLSKGSYTIKINSENQVYFIQKFIKN